MLTKVKRLFICFNFMCAFKKLGNCFKVIWLSIYIYQSCELYSKTELKSVHSSLSPLGSLCLSHQHHTQTMTTIFKPVCPLPTLSIFKSLSGILFKMIYNWFLTPFVFLYLEKPQFLNLNYKTLQGRALTSSPTTCCLAHNASSHINFLSFARTWQAHFCPRVFALIFSLSPESSSIRSIHGWPVPMLQVPGWRLSP